MWLTVLVLLVVAAVVYLLLRSQDNSAPMVQRQAASTAPAEDPDFRVGNYRIWIEGTKNGVQGRYYLVSYGLSKVATDRINAQVSQALTQSGRPGVVPARARISPAGATLFVFRREGDYDLDIKLHPENYLLPLGGEPDTGVDDVFRLESTATTLTLYTSDVFGQMPISPCYSENCIQGALLFNDQIGATPYTITPSRGGYIIGRMGTTPEYLTVGAPLCPPEAPPAGAGANRVNGYNYLRKKCSVFRPDERGGPSTALIQPSSAPLVFHFERL